MEVPTSGLSLAVSLVLRFFLHVLLRFGLPATVIEAMVVVITNLPVDILDTKLAKHPLPDLLTTVSYGNDTI